MILLSLHQKRNLLARLLSELVGVLILSSFQLNYVVSIDLEFIVYLEQVNDLLVNYLVIPHHQLVRLVQPLGPIWHYHLAIYEYFSVESALEQAHICKIAQNAQGSSEEGTNN